MAQVLFNSVISIAIANGGGAAMVQEVRTFTGLTAMNDCQRYEQRVHGSAFATEENGKNVSRIVTQATSAQRKTTEVVTFCWEQ